MDCKINFIEGTFNGLAEAELKLFYRLLNGVTGAGVEIGCLDGFSTAHLLNCSCLRLTSIDPFIPDSMDAGLIGSETRFHQNIQPWAARHTLVKDYSWNVVRNWIAPLDFLFIDGNHIYDFVLCDFKDWTPWLKTGGILAMHDSRMNRPGGATFYKGPSAVANEFVYGKPQQWEITGEAFSLTTARKRA